MGRLAGRLVYQKIRDALGIQQAVVSGGGSLQPHLDDFFEAVGITVVNGWGLSVRFDQIGWPRSHMLKMSYLYGPCIES